MPNGFMHISNLYNDHDDVPMPKTIEKSEYEKIMNNQFEYKRSDDRNCNEVQIQRVAEKENEGLETNKKNLANKNKESGN